MNWCCLFESKSERAAQWFQDEAQRVGDWPRRRPPEGALVNHRSIPPWGLQRLFTHSWLATACMLKSGRLREKIFGSVRESIFFLFFSFSFCLDPWSRNFHLVEEWKTWEESLCPLFGSLPWLGRQSRCVRVQPRGAALSQQADSPHGRSLPLWALDSVRQLCRVEGGLVCWLEVGSGYRGRQVLQGSLIVSKADHFDSVDLSLSPQWFGTHKGCDYLSSSLKSYYPCQCKNPNFQVLWNFLFFFFFKKLPNRVTTLSCAHLS